MYAKTNDFSGESKYYKKADIIERHHHFLEKYIDIIIVKLDKNLLAFGKQLTALATLVEKQVSFTNIVTLTFHCYEKIADDNHLFKKDILLECYAKRALHPRYQFTTDLFLQTLKTFIFHEIENIDELLENNFRQKRYPRLPKIETVFTESPHRGDAVAIEIDNEQSDKNYLRYELSILHEKKHPIFGFSYFRERFSTNGEVLDELSNMENNADNILEYYSSYQFIKKLLNMSDYT